MSLTASVPRVNANRQRAPLSPVNVVGRFIGGATDEDLLMGAAVLEIEDGRDQASYWCQATTDRGNVVGWKLRKFNSAEVHDLPANLSSCDCGDASFRPARPGGCRHPSALRQALAARWPVVTPA